MPGRPLDLLVVGAGPAGVAAAVEAHRSGLAVAVVDKARFPRDKTCGDGLTTGALRSLEAIGVDVRRLPSYASVHEAVIVGPDGRRVRLPMPAGSGEYAGVVPRRELDSALVLLARVRGIEVRDACALTSLEVGSDSVVATLGDGTTIRASWVLAADGHWSPTRRLAEQGDGSAPELGTWHAFRRYYRDAGDDRLWVLFERDLLPGYAWVFPIGGGRVNVGFGVLRGARTNGKDLAATWRDLLERPLVRDLLGPRAVPDGPIRAWPIPASWSEAALTGPPRVLYAGDAARVVDPLTGEGIAQALETGRLAARAVSFGGHPANVAAQYRSAAREALAADLRLARGLQRVLASPLGARGAIAAAGLTPWTRRNFARWMFEDYPRAAVATPRRWSAGMFTGAGAYAGR
jgi:geranylgeranyl reductase family protein